MVSIRWREIRENLIAPFDSPPPIALWSTLSEFSSIFTVVPRTHTQTFSFFKWPSLQSREYGQWPLDLSWFYSCCCQVRNTRSTRKVVFWKMTTNDSNLAVASLKLARIESLIGHSSQYQHQERVFEVWIKFLLNRSYLTLFSLHSIDEFWEILDQFPKPAFQMSEQSSIDDEFVIKDMKIKAHKLRFLYWNGCIEKLLGKQADLFSSSNCFVVFWWSNQAALN